MAVVGVLHMEVRIEHAASLKDKRNVVRSLKARLRSRHNVAIAEIEGQDTWQRAVVSAVTISADRTFATQVLQAAEADAASILGGMLISTSVEWLE